MKRFAAFIVVLCLSSLTAFAADPLLPESFEGWQRSATIKHGNDPAQVDPAYPAVLKEYGFQDYESADYTRGGRRITIRAARFENVTGSYGAFSFYRSPDMQNEDIGDAAASSNNRILFFHSNLLIDATLDKVTAMSAADLRVLAKSLPSAHGNAATPPNLPGYLPKEHLVRETSRYIIGPAALSLVHAPISAEQVNFEKFHSDAEVAMGEYADHDQKSTMVIVSYPTKEIATERLQNFQTTMGDAPGFLAKRTGDKVVLMTGDLPLSDEKSLVGSVNFDATVSWTEATHLGARDNVGNLIVAAFGLIGILLVIGIIFGVVFGGARVLITRVLPGRFHKGDEGEFINLDLR
jgi:hypothetical protein